MKTLTVRAPKRMDSRIPGSVRFLMRSSPLRQILVVFTKNGVQEGFFGELPVEQSLEVAEYTGPGYLTSVTPFGGFPAANAMLPWMPTSGTALLSLKAAQGTKYFFTILNSVGQPYTDVSNQVGEYHLRE